MILLEAVKKKVGLFFGQAPLPEQLPGDVFVLTYDRERGVFVLTLDTETNPSYNMGGDIEKIRMQFRLWGHYRLGCDAIDRAKEFGTVCAGLTSGRIVRSADEGPGPQLKWRDGEEESHGFRQLPSR